MWEFAYEKPHLSSKIQLKTWPLTLAEYQLSFSEVADLLHHCDKVHYFHWHFKSDIYDTHLFWFMQPFLSAANDRLKQKPSLGPCVWECVRVCVLQKTQIMKFMIWQTAEQLVWLSQLAEPAHCLIHRQFLWAERKPRLIHITAVMSPFKNSSLSREPLEQRSPISGPRCMSRLLPSSLWNTSHKLT